jgi:hypothetical protein
MEEKQTKDEVQLRVIYMYITYICTVYVIYAYITYTKTNIGHRFDYTVSKMILKTNE